MKTPLPKKLVSFERRQKLKLLRQKIDRALKRIESIPPDKFDPARYAIERAKLIDLYRQIDAIKAEKTIQPTFAKSEKFGIVITY